jgi:hypothetical protein
VLRDRHWVTRSRAEAGLDRRPGCHESTDQRRLGHHQHCWICHPRSVRAVMDAAYQGGNLTAVPLPRPALTPAPDADMTDDGVDRDLERMADNPATARAIRSALESLAPGADLAAMSRDILDEPHSTARHWPQSGIRDPDDRSRRPVPAAASRPQRRQRAEALDQAREQPGPDEAPPDPRI